MSRGKFKIGRRVSLFSGTPPYWAIMSPLLDAEMGLRVEVARYQTGAEALSAFAAGRLLNDGLIG